MAKPVPASAVPALVPASSSSLAEVEPGRLSSKAKRCLVERIEMFDFGESPGESVTVDVRFEYELGVKTDGFEVSTHALRCHGSAQPATNGRALHLTVAMHIG